MPPLTQDRLKRHADSDPEGEPPVKKFGLLQLGLSPRSSAAVQDTRKPIPQDYSINDGSMLLDDTKHTTYIYNIEQELADIEEHEKQISFIPEIEKALNAIPKSVLKEPETDKELILYRIPRSLTVPEDKDAVINK
ncbi:hypothetical protein BGW36DRAFT_425959 [Talaromyces proteolyticus]|uniref:Uncharacterized protein n=1 Tax=Talaromyces proteolyticus TaxID=1131652 RepID=A0AAD4Q384_9EURO|nr:uncharacterized protein BGW36DRAFT_425959 [Talaromyces proteolyticus]KAH8701166.1 hypothetical protein BGW36DRAFT_425959 [Talaromyces proteolyticus]